MARDWLLVVCLRTGCLLFFGRLVAVLFACRLVASCLFADWLRVVCLQTGCLLVVCRLVAGCLFADWLPVVRLQTGCLLFVCRLVAFCLFADCLMLLCPIAYLYSEGETKKRKTQADEAARARRVCVRLAAMANRCHWLSTTEITTHILTSGDALQSHYNVRVFTRQLQWAMQQCKRILNKEAPIEDNAQSQQSIQTARVQLQTPEVLLSAQGGAPQPADDDQGGAPQPAEDDVEGDVEVIEMDTCTTSTNASDDYTHRGFRLQAMPFYVYRMYVTYTTMEAYYNQ